MGSNGKTEKIRSIKVAKKSRTAKITTKESERFFIYGLHRWVAQNVNPAGNLNSLWGNIKKDIFTDKDGVQRYVDDWQPVDVHCMESAVKADAGYAGYSQVKQTQLFLTTGCSEVPVWISKTALKTFQSDLLDDEDSDNDDSDVNPDSNIVDDNSQRNPLRYNDGKITTSVSAGTHDENANIVTDFTDFVTVRVLLLADWQRLWLRYEADSEDEISAFAPLLRLFVEACFHHRTIQIMLIACTWNFFVNITVYYFILESDFSGFDLLIILVPLVQVGVYLIVLNLMRGSVGRLVFGLPLGESTQAGDAILRGNAAAAVAIVSVSSVAGAGVGAGVEMSSVEHGAPAGALSMQRDGRGENVKDMEGQQQPVKRNPHTSSSCGQNRREEAVGGSGRAGRAERGGGGGSGPAGRSYRHNLNKTAVHWSATLRQVWNRTYEELRALLYPTRQQRRLWRQAAVGLENGKEFEPGAGVTGGRGFRSGDDDGRHCGDLCVYCCCPERRQTAIRTVHARGIMGGTEKGQGEEEEHLTGLPYYQQLNVALKFLTKHCNVQLTERNFDRVIYRCALLFVVYLLPLYYAIYFYWLPAVTVLSTTCSFLFEGGYSGTKHAGTTDTATDETTLEQQEEGLVFCRGNFLIFFSTIGDLTQIFTAWLYSASVLVALISMSYGADIAHLLTKSWIARFGMLRRVQMPRRSEDYSDSNNNHSSSNSIGSCDSDESSSGSSSDGDGDYNDNDDDAAAEGEEGSTEHRKTGGSLVAKPSVSLKRAQRGRGGKGGGRTEGARERQLADRGTAEGSEVDVPDNGKRAMVGAGNASAVHSAVQGVRNVSNDWKSSPVYIRTRYGGNQSQRLFSPIDSSSRRRAPQAAGKWSSEKGSRKGSEHQQVTDEGVFGKNLPLKDLVPKVERDSFEHYLFIHAFMSLAGSTWSPALVLMAFLMIYILLFGSFIILGSLQYGADFGLPLLVVFVILRFIVLILFPLASICRANESMVELQRQFATAAPADYSLIGGKNKWTSFAQDTPAHWTVFGFVVTWDRLFGAMATGAGGIVVYGASYILTSSSSPL